jgi:FKBP-type peptidyl-prolyl cis-trans isomerase
MRVFLETRQQLRGPQTARAVRPRLAQMMPSAIKEHAAPAASAPVDAARRCAAMATLCLSVMVVSSHPALADSCPTFNTVSKGEAKGLQWCDVKVGDGDSPVPKAFIKAYVLFFPSILRERLLQITASRAYRRHYTGALDSEMASGVFDSSYDRRKPLGFMVGTHQVISGWDLGTTLENNLPRPVCSNARTPTLTRAPRSLVRSFVRWTGILGDGDELPPMKAHGIRKLVLPPNLAYGERGAGGVIPPNATLYFDIEFLGGIGKK